MTLKPLVSIGAAIAAIVALSGALSIVVSPTLASGQQQAPQTPAATEQDMMAMRKNMMAMREKMTAEIQAADARLQPLIDRMNAASGNAKIDAMAALLTELTAQHRAAQQRMGQMMMPGMMQMMGMMEGMNTNMQNMMRGRGAGTPPGR